MSNYKTVTELKTAVMEKLNTMLSANTDYQLYVTLKENEATAETELATLQSQRTDFYAAGNIQKVVELDEDIKAKRESIASLNKRIEELDGMHILTDSQKKELADFIEEGIAGIKSDIWDGAADQIDGILGKIAAFGEVVSQLPDIEKSMRKVQDCNISTAAYWSQGKLINGLEALKTWISE